MRPARIRKATQPCSGRDHARAGAAHARPLCLQLACCQLPVVDIGSREGLFLDLRRVEVDVFTEGRSARSRGDSRIAVRSLFAIVSSRSGVAIPRRAPRLTVDLAREADAPFSRRMAEIVFPTAAPSRVDPEAARERSVTGRPGEGCCAAGAVARLPRRNRDSHRGNAELVAGRGLKQVRVRAAPAVEVGFEAAVSEQVGRLLPQMPKLESGTARPSPTTPRSGPHR